ncbi:hypothetical protein N7466_005377 [Penicillium verhagenii]|uniref:uncharacterized protein n=1 Tax=Penicillium verhagenii TaxID=1562060 RepID=UPI0025458D0E|nr:uncharacterized protein N7466_005377 [Penicillium verhagenii]KAJ5935830.1 hypothetical protein N7466_005377 [Penicillium verhagenii]
MCVPRAHADITSMPVEAPRVMMGVPHPHAGTNAMPFDPSVSALQTMDPRALPPFARMGPPPAYSTPPRSFAAPVTPMTVDTRASPTPVMDPTTPAPTPSVGAPNPRYITPHMSFVAPMTPLSISHANTTASTRSVVASISSIQASPSDRTPRTPFAAPLTPQSTPSTYFNAFTAPVMGPSTPTQNHAVQVMAPRASITSPVTQANPESPQSFFLNSPKEDYPLSEGIAVELLPKNDFMTADNIWISPLRVGGPQICSHPVETILLKTDGPMSRLVWDGDFLDQIYRILHHFAIQPLDTMLVIRQSKQGRVPVPVATVLVTAYRLRIDDPWLVCVRMIREYLIKIARQPHISVEIIDPRAEGAFCSPATA